MGTPAFGGIGQLVYFGYEGFSDGKVWNLVFSIPLMAFLIFIAIYVLALADD